MSSCIIFACSVAPGREFVLDRFIETFKSKFSNSDIYVGVNPGNSNNVETILQESNLNYQLAKVDASLYTESDASAYQVALKLLYDSKKKYDNYWFVHTKSGFNSHSDYLREWYINNFLNRCDEIEYFMKSEEVGSYGMLGLEYDITRQYAEHDVEIDLWENIISDKLPCTHAYFFYIHTIYALTNKPMEVFFNLITDKWFNSKLDRYYFEGIFPFITSRAGCFPYLENIISMNGTNLQNHQLDWIKENQLENKYNHLLNKFKTNYNFYQLQPPYVNSNT
jgi:hypothetical protein